MVLGVILHEIAHAGHDSFPIFVLKIWEDIMTEESHLDVTPYAAKVRQKDSRKLKAEDFAESFRLFCLEPDNLRAVSMHRYLAMQEVCSLL